LLCPSFLTSPNWHSKLESTHLRLQFPLTPNFAFLTLKISHFSTYNTTILTFNRKLTLPIISTSFLSTFQAYIYHKASLLNPKLAWVVLLTSNMSSLAWFQQIPSQGNNLVELPIIAPKNPIPTNFKWEEVHPYLKFKAPRSRGRLQDSENGFSLQFGVERKRKGEEEGRKATWKGGRSFWNFWRKREKSWAFYKKWFCFLFFIFFSKSNCHMSHFKWSKRTHLFPLIWHHTQL